MINFHVFLCCIVLYFFCETSAAYCPQSTFTHGSKCYAFLGMDMSRNKSEHICKQTYSDNARLVEPLNYAENLLITQKVQEHASWHTWLQFKADGQYFVDDNNQTPHYTNFAVGEPFSVDIGYCLTIGLNGYWYSQQCEEIHTALCEFDMVPPTRTPNPTTTKPSKNYPSCVQKYLNFVPCKTGWEYYPPTCSCFKIISNTTYYNAMNICRSFGATLASVHDFGEAAFIQRLAASYNSYWPSTASGRDNVIIGLTYNFNSKTFKWDDSSAFDFYQGLAPGEPNQLSAQGQIIINNPMGYATYMRIYDCSFQTCRYAACKTSIY